MGPKNNSAQIGPKQLIICKNVDEDCENATTVLNTPEI